MLPLGMSKEKKKYEKKSVIILDGRCIHHLRYSLQSVSGTISDLKIIFNINHTHYKRPHPGRLGFYIRELGLSTTSWVNHYVPHRLVNWTDFYDAWQVFYAESHQLTYICISDENSSSFVRRNDIYNTIYYYILHSINFIKMRSDSIKIFSLLWFPYF